MKCPKCNGVAFVYVSRQKENSVFRKRVCAKCGHRFYTKEMIDPSARYKLTIGKKDKP